MAIASASVTELWYVFEVAGAIPATPVWQPIRYNDGGNSLALNAERIASEEVRGDRHKTADRRGTSAVGGDIVGQLAYGSMDDFFLAGFAGANWSTANTITATTIDAATGDSSFNDSGTGFTFAAGDMVQVSGFTEAANNGLFRVVTADSGTITVTDIEGIAVTLTTEASGDSVTITAQSELKTGTTRRKMAILERHTDLGIDYLYRGCEVDTIALQGAATEKWTVTATMIGVSQEELASLPAGSTFATPTTSDFMTALDGSVGVAGVEYGFCTEFSNTIGNGIESKYVVGSISAIDSVISPITADGSLNAFFDSAALYNRFLNNDQQTLSLIATDGANAYRWRVPAATFVSGTKQSLGTDVVVNLGYSAGYDAVELSEVVLERV